MKNSIKVNKNKWLPSIIITIFSGLLIICLIPNSIAITPNLTPAPINDDINDVIKISLTDPNINTTGDFADMIDVVSFTISGQNITLNFQANWSKSNVTAKCTVLIDANNDSKYDYSLIWMIAVPTPNSVILQKNNTGKFWDGTNWNINIFVAESIGSATGNKIISQIPTEALNITSNCTYSFQTMIQDSEYSYLDTEPPPPPEPPITTTTTTTTETEIPGFLTPMILFSLLGLSLIYILLKKKDTIF